LHACRHASGFVGYKNSLPARLVLPFSGKRLKKNPFLFLLIDYFLNYGGKFLL
jgi:hypothetical protein